MKKLKLVFLPILLSIGACSGAQSSTYTSNGGCLTDKCATSRSLPEYKDIETTGYAKGIMVYDIYKDRDSLQVYQNTQPKEMGFIREFPGASFEFPNNADFTLYVGNDVYVAPSAVYVGDVNCDGQYDLLFNCNFGSGNIIIKTYIYDGKTATKIAEIQGRDVSQDSSTAHYGVGIALDEDVLTLRYQNSEDIMDGNTRNIAQIGRFQNNGSQSLVLNWAVIKN